MSFNVKTLIFNLPALEVAGTIKTFEGFGFQPKAIFVHWNGRPETVTALGRRNINGGFGAATSTTNRGCCSVFEQDAQASMTGGGRIDNAAVAQRNSADGTATASVDFHAFTADGVQLIIDDDLSTSMDLQITAYGGDDITDAFVLPFRWGPSMGNQDIHGLPFDPGSNSLFLFYGMPAIRADAPALDEDVIELTFGAARSASPIQQFVITGKQDDDAADANTKSYCRTDECLATIPGSGADPNARASFVGSIADGFTLDVTEHAPVTASSAFVLVLKGPTVHIADFNTLVGDTTTIQSITGIPFAPGYVSMFGHGGKSAESPSDTGENLWEFVSGGASTPSDQMVLSIMSDNLSASSQTSSMVRFDSVWAVLSTVGTFAAGLEFIALTSDGFQVRMLTSSITLFIPYIAYASEAPAPPAGDSDGGEVEERESPQATWNKWGPWRAKVRRILEERELDRAKAKAEQEALELDIFRSDLADEEKRRLIEAIAALLAISEL